MIEENMQKRFPLLRCFHPYDPTNHPWSFVKGVLERSQSALSILHDLTDYAPGVLVEIGYSIGFNKHPVLFWDGSVSPFDPGKLPRVIDRVHIHQVDLSKEQERRALADTVFRTLQNEPPRLDRPSLRAGWERRALIVVSGRHQRLRESLPRMLQDYDLEPVHEDRLPNEENPTRLLNGILSAKYVVVDVTENDPVGLIALGIAAAQKRRIFALHKGPPRPSMLDQPSYSWSDDAQLDTELRKWFEGVRAGDSVESRPS